MGKEGAALSALSPRLQAVAELVLPGRPVADIGTDHGYLPLYLLEQGWVPRAIATDRMPGPLAAAQRTMQKAAAEGRVPAHAVELRMSDGLGALKPGEAATVVLSGMGGLLMLRILGERPQALQGVQRLVLQPNSDVESVRRWLVRQGWRLVDERLVAEGKHYYFVLAAEPRQGAAAGGWHGARPDMAAGVGSSARSAREGEVLLAIPRDEDRWSAADWLLGPYVRRRGGPVFFQYVKAERQRTERALTGLRRARQPDPDQLAELTRRLDVLESEWRRLTGAAPTEPTAGRQEPGRENR